MGKKQQKPKTVKIQHIEQSQPKQKIKLQQKQAHPKKEQLRPSYQVNVQNNQNQTEPKNQRKTKKILKHARLIIRNLVFDINEKHIKKLMAPYGQVKQVNIPLHPDRKGAKGFAFVQMSNKNQCLRAIKKLNGTKYKGRPIVLDMAVAKDRFMTEKLNQKQDQVKSQTKNEVKQQQQQMSNQDKNTQNKVKKQNQQPQQQQQQQENQQQNEEDDSASQQDIQQKANKQKQDHQHQVFIRNLPISATEDDLYKHFIKLGKIKFVRVCKNKQTNVSKGTAFIKFHDAQVAKKLIEYSRSYEMFLLKKHNHFVNDPTIRLQIDGIIMKIFPVQTRKDIVDKLKQRQGEDKTQKKAKPLKRIKKLEDIVKIDTHGKRKLALALLGKWKANQNMNSIDYQLLKNHEREKIQRLKNPNTSISPTRIILKHLEKTITEEQIRSICYKFLQDHDLNKSSLTYCKLMLEKDMKRSAGFAFVQFKKHETAKQFLELLSKKPHLLQNKLFIVQFAIQDSRKMLKLSKKNQASKTPADKNEKKEDKNFKKFNKDKKRGDFKAKKSSNFKRKFIKK